MGLSREPLPRRFVLGLALAGLIPLAGCSGQPETGTLAPEKVEGQVEGEKASMDAMRAMMKQQSPAK